MLSPSQAPHTTAIKAKIKRDNLALTPDARIAKFIELQRAAFSRVSQAGQQRFTQRNIGKRAVANPLDPQ